jgi:hypothetical protein
MKDENGNVLYSATYKNTLYKSGKKKGLPKKIEATIIDYSSGKKVTTHYTTKIKYKLNKHGKITKETQITTGDIKDKTVTKITYKKFKVPKKYRNLLLEWSVPWENR